MGIYEEYYREEADTPIGSEDTDSEGSSETKSCSSKKKLR
jgi:hypothetical protein